MFCPHCGAKVPDNTAFCGFCGNPISASNSQPEDSTQLLEDSTQLLPEEPVYPVPPQPAPPAPYYPQPAPHYPPQPAYAPPKKKSKTGLIVGLSAGGGVVLIGMLILILVLVTGGKKLPVMEHLDQTYAYGDPSMLSRGMYELDEYTGILLREDPKTGLNRVVMLTARTGSSASIGGVQPGDSYLTLQAKFRGITAQRYNPMDDSVTEMSPWDMAIYDLYYVDGKTYSTQEYYKAMPNMAENPEAYQQFRENTYMLSVRVENGVVQAIYFGDHRALTTLR